MFFHLIDSLHVPTDRRLGDPLDPILISKHLNHVLLQEVGLFLYQVHDSDGLLVQFVRGFVTQEQLVL